MTRTLFSPTNPRRAFLWKSLTLLLLALLALTPRGGASVTEECAPAKDVLGKEHPLTRVAFIGASVSAGFGNARELQVGRNVPLGGFFESLLGPEHQGSEVYDFGSSQFFTGPETMGEQQVNKALAKRPTLVVGIDFLFWYAFGYPREDSPRRAEGLERGLKLLETIEGPLLIGDLPNVDHALQGKSPLRGGHPILSPRQIPSEQERVQMNLRIHEWASQRSNVRVFPLAKLLKQMVDGGEMGLQGNTWQIESLDECLQTDWLHPNVRGTVWVALYVADATLAWPGIERGDFVWDEAVIQRTLWHALEAARAKQKAREDRLEERRAKREREKAGSK